MKLLERTIEVKDEKILNKEITNISYDSHGSLCITYKVEDNNRECFLKFNREETKMIVNFIRNTTLPF